MYASSYFSYARTRIMTEAAVVTTTRMLVAMALVACALLVVYIGLNNRVAGRGYELKNVDRSIHELSRSVGELQFKTAVELSSTRLVERSKSLGLTAPVSVQYIVAGAGAVAVR